MGGAEYEYETEMEIVKPILFNTPNVQAILDGRKTQTRRVVKPQPALRKGLDLAALNTLVEEDFWYWKDCNWLDGGLGMPESAISDYAPYQPGDVLWVRETWRVIPTGYSNSGEYDFKAKRLPPLNSYTVHIENPETIKWRPSIHMPRAAARIFLRVTDVRAERVRDISEKDCIAEGIRSYFLHKEHGGEWGESSSGPFVGADNTHFTRIGAFAELWDSLNAKRGYGWNTNPWVWVYEFERVAV